MPSHSHNDKPITRWRHDFINLCSLIATITLGPTTTTTTATTNITSWSDPVYSLTAPNDRKTTNRTLLATATPVSGNRTSVIDSLAGIQIWDCFDQRGIERITRSSTLTCFFFTSSAPQHQSAPPPYYNDFLSPDYLLTDRRCFARENTNINRNKRVW